VSGLGSLLKLVMKGNPKKFFPTPRQGEENLYKNIPVNDESKLGIDFIVQNLEELGPEIKKNLPKVLDNIIVKNRTTALKNKDIDIPIPTDSMEEIIPFLSPAEKKVITEIINDEFNVQEYVKKFPRRSLQEVKEAKKTHDTVRQLQITEILSSRYNKMISKYMDEPQINMQLETPKKIKTVPKPANERKNGGSVVERNPYEV
jgi:hypothetical protein